MSNGTISIKEIVEKVCDGNPEFRAYIFEKAMGTLIEQGALTDSLLFYALAIRLHSVDKEPQHIRHHLQNFADALRNEKIKN